MFIKNKQFYIIAAGLIVFLFSSLAVQAMGGSKFKITITPAPQCADGLDNDNDGKIDYPNDPDCSSLSDDREAPDTLPPSGGGGGGGGGVLPGLVINPTTSASFAGKSYPSSIVKLLRDGELAASTISGKDANFQMAIQGLSPGNHLFSVYSEDAAGRRSVILPFNLFVAQGAIIQLTGIFIPPTIEINKTDFLPGEVVNILGQTAPASQVSITVHSDQTLSLKTEANNNGFYFYSLDTSLLEIGSHELKTRSSHNGEVSDFSPTLSFRVSNEIDQATTTADLEPVKLEEAKQKVDFNNDQKINLIDFSIAAFWYKQAATTEAAKKVDLNNDGIINLIDFSILAYYWTG
ncbi:MAG: hypothetical protein NTX66_00815 [Candidatus Falkowbacteria bacterium]|nr:hypothetical protein [Candidatus Falkowbacteria bacterium]